MDHIIISMYNVMILPLMIKPDNVVALYMRWVYWEERVKSDMYFLDIVGRGFFLLPTLDIMVLVGINIVKIF